MIKSYIKFVLARILYIYFKVSQKMRVNLRLCLTTYVK